MTGQDAFEARLERLLLELSAPAATPPRPEVVAAAVADQQRGRRGLIRWGGVPGGRLVAVAALAILTTALVAGVLLGGGSRVAPVVNESPRVSASAAAYAAQCADAIDVSEACWEFGPIEVITSDTESVDVDGVAFSFDVVGEGWEKWGNISLNKSVVRSQAAEALIYWTAFPSGEIAKRCWYALEGPIGPSISDAARAVAAAPGIDVITRPTDVEVGGRPASYVEVIVDDPSPIWGCDPGYFHAWSSPYWAALWRGPGLGATIRVWIVDVDGTRLFIAGETKAEVDPSFEEIRSIVESIRFH